MIQDYLCPASVQEALDLLALYAGRARIIGGGTDLLLEKEAPDYYVDLGRISELDGIVEKDGHIVIGANVTHAQCVAHPLILKNAPLLAQASGTVGSTQIRNVATLAGNIVSANPAADAAVALTALQAVVTVTSQCGTADRPITGLYAGVGRSTVDCGAEIIVNIKFPVRQPGEGGAYERLQQRQGLSLPMASAAVSLGLSQGLISQAVIVAAPLAPGPTRVAQAEKILLGQKPTEEMFRRAGELAGDSVTFRSSPTRGGAEYRHRVLPVLVRRALRTAAERALS